MNVSKDLSNYFRSFTINSSVYGSFKIKRPIPIDKEFWGVLQPLKTLELAKHIPVIDSRVFSFALHGHVKPFLEVLGREPKYNLLINKQHVCLLSDSCLSFNAKKCFPNTHMPVCYEYPKNTNPDLTSLVNELFISWQQGYYVIVVDGEEFIL